MLLDEGNLGALARGCPVLGAGGGGDPRIGLLIARQAVGEFGPVPLVDLDNLPGDALVLPCGGIGAPTVSLEKIQNGSKCERLREAMEAEWGQPVAALMCGEIGGSNGVMPVAWSARLGLPSSMRTGWVGHSPRSHRSRWSSPASPPPRRS